MKTVKAHNAQLIGEAEIIGDVPVLPAGFEHPTPDRLAIVYKRLRNKMGTAPTKYPSHLEWIRHQACVVCAKNPPSQAHHVFGSFGSHKTSDLSTIPLCPDCHSVNDQKAEMVEHLVTILVLFVKKKSISLGAGRGICRKRKVGFRQTGKESIRKEVEGKKYMGATIMGKAG